MAKRQDNKRGEGLLKRLARRFTSRIGIGRNTPETSTDRTATAAPSSNIITNHILDAMSMTKSMNPGCMICLEDLDESDPANHKCLHCPLGRVCASCLKHWFTNACKDESQMPPRCCSIIPLSSAKHLLTTAQIELFEAKFEEWKTPNRIYCPVPTCSTFIPQKLYMSQQPTSEDNNLIEPGASASVKRLSLTKDQVTCHACHASVCTRCHALMHDEECPDSKLDPELDECLKDWNVKRCPKCRVGVNKGIGCALIECRCGAIFCFYCLQPPDTCENKCDAGKKATAAEQEAERTEMEEEYRKMLREEADRIAARDEKIAKAIISTVCAHEFHHTEPRKRWPFSSGDVKQECAVCSKLVKTIETPKTKPSATKGPPTTRQVRYNETAWECKCGITICGACKDSYTKALGREQATKSTQDPNI